MDIANVKATIKFVDVTAISKATMVFGSSVTLNTNLFKLNDNTVSKKYGTFESNGCKFVLDGTFDEYPNSPTDIGYVSSNITGENGFFNTPEEITIMFGENHSSNGITFYFGGTEYPKEIKIKWFSESSLVSEKTFYPNDMIYSAYNPVENYTSIIIEVYDMGDEYSHFWLQYIMFGSLITWNDGNIISSSVHEEIDQTGATLSINTAQITVIDEDNDFDLGNENGAWKSIQKTQEVNLLAQLDNDTYSMGTFFIDTFSFSENEVTFSLIDTIGLMDNYKFTKGKIYTNESVENILTDVFEQANISKYSIDEELKDISLNGWLGIMSCREALQMVCFSIGAVADDSRSDTVRIYKPNRNSQYNITPDRKVNGTLEISKEDYVSAVAIECIKYTEAQEVENIYDDNMDSGVNIIEFSKPYKNVTVTGANVVETKTNYIKLNVPTAGAVLIRGLPYDETKFTYKKSVEQLSAGESENVVTFSGITLYNTDLLPSKANDLMKYYSLQKSLRIEYLIEKESVGNWVSIYDVDGNQALSFITAQDIDMSGGFISNAQFTGYSKVLNFAYYTGEFYTNESIGDI